MNIKEYCQLIVMEIDKMYMNLKIIENCYDDNKVEITNPREKFNIIFKASDNALSIINEADFFTFTSEEYTVLLKLRLTEINSITKIILLSLKSPQNDIINCYEDITQVLIKIAKITKDYINNISCEYTEK